MNGSDCLKLAACARCPLGRELRRAAEFAPVPADLTDALVLLIDDAPGKTEHQNNVQWTGPRAADVLSMLERQGLGRDDASWTSVVACRYPKDDRYAFNARLRKLNDKRKREGDQPLPTPEECCRPRLDAEMKQHELLVTFGSPALKAVGTRSLYTDAPNRNPKITDYRGAPAKAATGHKLLATRIDWRKNPEWRKVVYEDLERAWRYLEDELDWTEPTIIYQPAVSQLEKWLFPEGYRERPRSLVYDVETAPSGYSPKGKKLYDARTDGLRCIGIGNADEVYVVPVLGIDGKRVFYTQEDQERMRKLLIRFFRSKHITKVGHNLGYYDRMVIENHYGVTPKPILDTVLLHKLADPEYPHRLAFLGSRWTDAPAWKSEHTATEAETDEELWLYCARDCAVNARVTAPCVALARQRKHAHLYPTYVRLQDQCVRTHKLGMRIDEHTRAKHERRLDKEAAAALQIIGDIADPGLNPRSVPQLQRLLYDDWTMPVLGVTPTGEPSTDDTTVRALLASPVTTEVQAAFLYALRRYRKATKALDTYIWKWRRGQGLVTADGHIFPDYNPGGTVMWRWSSANPNFQNTPFRLRDCFVPPEDYAFVGADYDALELVLVAAIANAVGYLDMFEEKAIDAHNYSGQLVFGKEYWNAEGSPRDPTGKGTGKFKKRRELIKRFVYQVIYGGLPPGIRAKLTEAEDDDGNLMFLDLTMREVRNIRTRWLEAAPEFKPWWHRVKLAWRRNGYVEEPIWGLRRYIVGSGRAEENEAINAGVQGGGGAIVHQGMFNVEQAFRFRPGEGLCLQIHDSLAYCVHNDRAEEMEQVLKEQLAITHHFKDGRPVDFTATPSIGFSLKEV